MTTHADLQDWLNRYIAAWRSNDPGEIGALFSDDAVYHYHPYGDDAVRGRDAIVSSWLEEGDPPDGWDAAYEPYAVDGDRAVAVGWSRYEASDAEPKRTYRNAFLLRFAADGRCTEFTEYFMLEKAPE